MKTLTYGFFGEDIPQRIFLEKYLARLNQLLKGEVEFRASMLFNQSFEGHNNLSVDNGVGTAAARGFAEPRFKLNCLFIGRDLDSSADTAYEHRVEILRGKIPAQLHDCSLFMLPMQCIEHWLLYLKRNEHRAEPLETLSNKAAKEEVYGKRHLPASLQRKVIDELANDLRIDWLANRSPTFKLFHEQVQQYLQTVPAA